MADWDDKELLAALAELEGAGATQWLPPVLPQDVPAAPGSAPAITEDYLLPADPNEGLWAQEPPPPLETPAEAAPAQGGAQEVSPLQNQIEEHNTLTEEESYQPQPQEIPGVDRPFTPAENIERLDKAQAEYGEVIDQPFEQMSDEELLAAARGRSRASGGQRFLAGLADVLRPGSEMRSTDRLRSREQQLMEQYTKAMSGDRARAAQEHEDQRPAPRMVKEMLVQAGLSPQAAAKLTMGEYKAVQQGASLGLLNRAAASGKTLAELYELQRKQQFKAGESALDRSHKSVEGAHDRASRERQTESNVAARVATAKKRGGGRGRKHYNTEGLDDEFVELAHRQYVSANPADRLNDEERKRLEHLAYIGGTDAARHIRELRNDFKLAQSAAQKSIKMTENYIPMRASLNSVAKFRSELSDREYAEVFAKFGAGSHTLNEEQQRMHAAIERVQQQWGKIVSGAQMSDNEAKRIAQSMGVSNQTTIGDIMKNPTALMARFKKNPAIFSDFAQTMNEIVTERERRAREMLGGDPLAESLAFGYKPPEVQEGTIRVFKSGDIKVYRGGEWVEADEEDRAEAEARSAGR